MDISFKTSFKHQLSELNSVWFKYGIAVGVYVPLIFLFLMFLYIGIARVQLGYWPTYGTRPDPAAFGFLPLQVIGFVGFLLLLISPIVWVSTLAYGYETYGKKFKINKLSVCCFLSGIIIFFVMKFYFSDILDWYMD